MLKVNTKILNTAHFPDGTQLLHPEDIKGNSAYIEWYYENDEELVTLIFITRHIKSLGKNVYLFMPYLPNARQDRVKKIDDVFTLKYFAEIINSLEFNRVLILDVHSSVSEALINNADFLSPKIFIEEAINDLDVDNLALYFPDEGSMKRYSSMFTIPYAFGIKNRDWSTGKINSVDVINGDLVTNKNVLIIDDICSKGGTFYYGAKALANYSPSSMNLYITHCENTIAKGDLLKSEYISRYYTTDSIANNAVSDLPNFTVYKSVEASVFKYLYYTTKDVVNELADLWEDIGL